MNMDVDVDANSRPQGKEEGKCIMVTMVGAPGSGKSTFCDEVMRISTRQWVRVCQDNIGNGKAGTRAQCMNSAATALNDGKCVFIDRCNLDKEQRSEFVKLGGSIADVHAVVLDLPARVCISRSVTRTGHEGNLQGGRAAAVVNRMLQSKEWPKLSEGFSRITFCYNDNDVKGALKTYSELGPSDSLPQGVFGEKSSDSKVQVGIMKFFKKTGSVDNNAQNLASVKNSNEKACLLKEENTTTTMESNKHKVSTGVSVNENISSSESDVPTLAFPSISTSDFQFNHDKASDIIVEKVEEFVNKIGNARLVLVDLTRGSKILSLVKLKALEKNIDPNKFFTFVGDITRLHSQGGLRCHVIANAANWRLKPGGGGVNAAIFSAAGPSLEVATKEQAKSLTPGSAVVVSLPPNSPLFIREGVSYVIHVLGPNMNPQRTNCLDNDYVTGCKILREAYTSLFEGFASVLSKVSKASFERHGSKKSEILDQFENVSRISDQKDKRENMDVCVRPKKSKGMANLSNETSSGSRTKSWGSWALALYNIAKQPEKYTNVVLEASDDVVVLNDLYPKARKHLLVLTRHEGLDGLTDLRKEHLHLLRTMHSVGLKWAEKFLCEDRALIFRLGYHSVPSMRQLHLHVISQDFDSQHLKNKKHWNSFTSLFFRDSIEVMEEIEIHGKAKVEEDDKILAMELRCHRCKSAHPNIPRLKSHVANCRSPFPANLLENNYLVCSTEDAGSLSL